MTFAALHSELTARLDEADRGDRAWWLLTRVHLNASRLQQIVAYLHDAGADTPLELTATHYENLATILDIDTPNPALGINRHYFLAMDTPLHLIRRPQGNLWREIALTDAGVELATDTDAAKILERQLDQIVFCRSPFYNQGRAEEYSEFNVRPYSAILDVMANCSGYVDVDEFDLFVSRIRTYAEIPTAIARIATFRILTDAQKQILRNLVSVRIPAGGGNDPQKPYRNWRDMARHTFAFFSLGQRAQQVDNRLYLTQSLAVSAVPSPAVALTPAVPVLTEPPTATQLLIPSNIAPPELLTPPPPPQVNNGASAELRVGKIFASAGWEVVYYSQRRGYGFDLWVRKNNQAFVVEVKSFVGQGGAAMLTSLEYQDAQHHGLNFLLVLVENANSDAPTIHVVQNPTASLNFTQTQIYQFSAPRAEWLEAAEDLQP
jgi:hypothetical protein